jgi:MATE family multidrug resistance protein
MLSPERRKTILTLAWPIIGAMLSQNIVNLVDTAMVGHLDNPTPALAATGTGGFLSFMSAAFITGLAAGVQAIAARRMGEGKVDEMALPLNGGLLLAVVLGVPIASLLYGFAPEIFGMVQSDPEVVALGAPYYQMRLLGMVALGCNFAFRGYWNGTNYSRFYMQTLLIMHACNVFLNWVLIYGNLGAPELGVMGAGLATTLSFYIGTAMYMFMGWKHAKSAGFLRALPTLDAIKTMLRLAVPSGIQNFFFAFGMVVMLKLIGKIGTLELAASNVLINLLLVGILPAMGFGLASASLVGQALGRKDIDAAQAWGYDVAKLTIVIVGLMVLPAFVIPDLMLSGFISDPETREVALVPLYIAALTVPIDALGVVLMNALLGAGASRVVMGVSVAFQWVLALPAIWLVQRLGGGLVWVWVVQICYRGMQSGIFAWIWKRKGWASIKV